VKYNNITGETPAPSRVGLVQLFNQYMKIASRDFHTQLPAKVLEVDYEKGFVTVQPLIRTMIEVGSGEEVELLPVDEVPIMYISSKRGKARLTTPVTVGDVGILYFAERDTGIYRNSDGTKIVNSGEYAGQGFDGSLTPIGFFPEIFTASSNRSIPSDATVLEDGVSSVSLKESGEITVKNENVTIKANPDGSNSITNGGGTFSMTADGTVNINGFIINPDGSVTFPSSITGPTVTAQTSLTVAGKEMDQHIHSDGTYVAGTTDVTGNSGAPV
jgi:hypothetical protein